MTSIQLAHLCARNLRQPDITLMPVGALRDVLAAMNAALQKLYEKMPATHRTTTVSEVLRAPQTVSYDIADRYENRFLNTPFTAAMRGCTVYVGDDPQPNEIVLENAILDGFLGQTFSGTATVYFDAVQIVDVIARVASDVRLYQAGQCVGKLDRCEERRWASRSKGTPRRYYLEACGSAHGSEPEFILRVDPMPERDYKIRFEAELATVRVTFAQVSRDAVNLPVNDRLCESVLVPLAEAELIRSPHFADMSKASAIREARDAAFECIGYMPSDMGVGNNDVGTPEGF